MYFNKVPGIVEPFRPRRLFQKGEAGGRFYGRKEFVILRGGADEHGKRGPVSLNLTFNFFPSVLGFCFTNSLLPMISEGSRELPNF